MQWLNRRSELGGNNGILSWWVGWLRRKLPVKFRPHQKSYLSHVLNAVNIKSQFYIYFTSRKTQINITCSKLNWELQIFGSIRKCQVYIHKAQLVKCWECLIQFVSKHFVSVPPANPNKAQDRQFKYKVKFTCFFATIFAVKI